MWEQIINVAAANGIWAMLFVALLIYQLQDSRKREIKYQATIDNLSHCLKLVETIEEDVKDVKDIVKKSDSKYRRKEVGYES